MGEDKMLINVVTIFITRGKQDFGGFNRSAAATHGRSPTYVCRRHHKTVKRRVEDGAETKRKTCAVHIVEHLIHDLEILGLCCMPFTFVILWASGFQVNLKSHSRELWGKRQLSRERNV
ncbi:hypothetical protein L596_010931 [Steinernema carpocapsae]|uniref:Uncharacterized protein n=1 Tax=Steinernema carpocapsae TaxID=34508 RepID=A0A4U5PK21_STECR|nr:hypothetical protein L596_010931 [Steinernema carpocapsae]